MQVASATQWLILYLTSIINLLQTVLISSLSSGMHERLHVSRNKIFKLPHYQLQNEKILLLLLLISKLTKSLIIRSQNFLFQTIRKRHSSYRLFSSEVTSDSMVSYQIWQISWWRSSDNQCMFLMPVWSNEVWRYEWQINEKLWKHSMEKPILSQLKIW